MARRRIIEGTWTCTSCRKEGIAGRERRCPGCGSPREADGPESTFDFGPQTETGRSVREGVSDADLITRADAGVDWFCGYCGAGNAGDGSRCRHCSAPRTEEEGPGAEEAEEAAPPPPPAAAPVAPARRSRRGAWVLLLAGVAGFVWWGTRERADEGRVEQVRWSRVVRQERFAPETREGWRDELSPRTPVMPVGGRGEVAGLANIRDCHRAQRGTRQVADGTERVCRSRTRRVQCGTEERCHRKDLRNGFAEEVCEDVPRYCSEPYEECRNETRYVSVPVYGQRCSYDTYVWKRLDSRTLSGTADAPRWPEVQVGPNDRLVREETYAVDIAWGKGKHHTLELSSEAAFRPWKPGARVALTVNNFGRVTEARLTP